MIPMELGPVADAMGADCLPIHRDLRVLRVVTDSREVQPGDLFFAFRGQRVDGREFVSQAFSNGAIACVCCREGTSDPRHGETEGAPRLLVDDTVEALGALAAYFRRRVLSQDTVVVGVTGSNGKTTTKCMLDHVLGALLPGRASPKSFNNSLGVPLTLLSAEPGDRYLIVEMGSNAPGEIAALAALAGPQVGVITSVGESHLAGFGSVEGVACEKAALLDSIQRGGLAVVNTDRPEIHPHLGRAAHVRLITVGFDSMAKLRITRATGGIDHVHCELDGRFEVSLKVPGPHHAANAAATFAVARWFGLDPNVILRRLSTFQPPEGRTRVLEIDGLTLVDDAYNANPSSVSAAIAALRTIPSRRRVFVLGDMLELGAATAASHQAVVQAVLQAGIEMLLTVGPEANAAAWECHSRTTPGRVYPCDSVEAATELLLRRTQCGDVIWVKASRGMGLDQLISKVQARRLPKAAVA